MRFVSVVLATLMLVGCAGPGDVMAPIRAMLPNAQTAAVVQPGSDAPYVDPTELQAIDDAEARGGKPDGDLDRFHKVGEGLFRGARPSDKGLATLKAQGVRTVINLEDDEKAIAHERYAAKKLDLRVISLPMNAKTIPSLKTAQTFLKLATDPANQPVYFHCTWGRDRTGTMAYVYRVTVDHWSHDKAYGEMVKMGFRRILLGLNAFVKWYGWKYATSEIAPTTVATGHTGFAVRYSGSADGGHR